MKKIRAAIVGYGNIGRYTLQALEAAPDFEVAGIVRRKGAENCPEELKKYDVKGAVLRAVQVDNVEVLCACGQELPCLGTGVLAVYGHAAVVALGQAHHLAAAQINGWKQLHHILLITPQTLSGCAGRCRRSFPGGTGCRTPCPPVPRR